ncbi:hypothetical protein TI39_contig408g00013 [Zymoseptoria brevis]|uniref:Uncharacterized protein n=1 Tax=Zymoseptoria brevis TaxID=1047168 RepID=A0A0F4GN85_9PEZI|nr:hypothetical protein TI39_contig408g00013 [Zymoseptoria brevis]
MRLADIRFQDDPFSAITVSVDQIGLDRYQEIDVLDLAGYKRGRHEDDEGDREPSKAAQRNPDTERSHAPLRRASDAVKVTAPAITNANKDATKKSRKHKLLKPINALWGQPPLNIKEIFSKIMIEIPITWMQFSLFFRDETKRLFSSPRPRRSKPKKEDSDDEEEDQLYDTDAYEDAIELRIAAEAYKKLMHRAAAAAKPISKATSLVNKEATIFPQSAGVTIPQHASAADMEDDDMLQIEEINVGNMTVEKLNNVDHLCTEILADIDRWNKRDTSHRAFGVPAVTTNTHTKKQGILPLNQCIADSGADISLMCPHSRTALGLKLYDANTRSSPMAMSNIDGAKCALNHFVVFDVHVEGIKRTTWAFASRTEKTDQKLSLILSVPTLNSINAVIHCGKGTVQLGDAECEEDVIILHPSLSASVAPETTMRSDGVKELFEDSNDDSYDGSDSESGEEIRTESLAPSTSRTGIGLLRFTRKTVTTWHSMFMASVNYNQRGWHMAATDRWSPSCEATGWMLREAKAIHQRQLAMGTAELLRSLTFFAHKHQHFFSALEISTVYTDYKPITGFMNAQTSDIYTRWQEKIRPLNIKILHIEGQKN